MAGPRPANLKAEPQADSEVDDLCGAGGREPSCRGGVKGSLATGGRLCLHGLAGAVEPGWRPGAGSRQPRRHGPRPEPLGPGLSVYAFKFPNSKPRAKRQT